METKYEPAVKKFEQFLHAHPYQAFRWAMDVDKQKEKPYLAIDEWEKNEPGSLQAVIKAYNYVLQVIKQRNITVNDLREIHKLCMTNVQRLNSPKEQGGKFRGEYDDTDLFASFPVTYTEEGKLELLENYPLNRFYNLDNKKQYSTNIEFINSKYFAMKGSMGTITEGNLEQILHLIKEKKQTAQDAILGLNLRFATGKMELVKAHLEQNTLLFNKDGEKITAHFYYQDSKELVIPIAQDMYVNFAKLSPSGENFLENFNNAFTIQPITFTKATEECNIQLCSVYFNSINKVAEVNGVNTYSLELIIVNAQGQPSETININVSDQKFPIRVALDAIKSIVNETLFFSQKVGINLNSQTSGESVRCFINEINKQIPPAMRITYCENLDHLKPKELEIILNSLGPHFMDAMQPTYIRTKKNNQELKNWAQKLASDLNAEVGNALQEYHTNISTCTNLSQKIESIVSVVQKLEQIHPFSDCNCRTFCMVLLNAVLMQNNILPSLVDNPNTFDGCSISYLTKSVHDGIILTKKLMDYEDKNHQLQPEESWLAIAEDRRAELSKYAFDLIKNPTNASIQYNLNFFGHKQETEESKESINRVGGALQGIFMTNI